MNRKVLSLILLIFGWILIANAQDDGKIVLKGMVADGKTNEPIPFANMGVLGTVAGVATGLDGTFELTLPLRYATHKIRISAIGYAPYEIKVYEIKSRPDLKIMLQPISYDMNEVDVYGQLLVYKKMLSDVASDIPKNYIAKPYNYEGYFKYKTEKDGVEKIKEAIVNIYDARGYYRSDVATAFKDLNYHFSQVRRTPENKSIKDGINYFDDILTADIIRNTRNVLDINNSRDYKLASKGKTDYEGNPVQIITYEAEKPSLTTTGNASVQKYKGEIYINTKDNAVLKNVIQITARDFNSLGRNLIAINSAPKEDVKLTITTSYKKLKSLYFLSGVTIEYTYKEAGKEVKGEMQYITTRVNMNHPTPIEGRSYYEDMKVNHKFWNQFSLYFEEEK